jgi:hypothetical protein
VQTSFPLLMPIKRELLGVISAEHKLRTVLNFSQGENICMAPITYCPPRSAHGTDPEPQFIRPQYPISATFDAHGEARATGISFGDYNFMQTAPVKHPKWRRIKPAWILDTEKFREVVTRLIEKRACFSTAQPGTHQERMERAQLKLNKSRDKRIKVLDDLCSRYLAAKLAGEPTEYLARKIEEADTYIAHLDRTAGLITAILFLSYRAEMNSVDVSAILACVKPPLVRQTCYRARKLAERIFSGEEQQTASARKKESSRAECQSVKR